MGKEREGRRNMDKGSAVFPGVGNHCLFFLVDCSRAWLLGCNMALVYKSCESLLDFRIPDGTLL